MSRVLKLKTAPAGQPPIKIERGIPLARDGRGRRSSLPWEDMQIGDSFLVPRGKINNCCKIAGDHALRRGTKYACRTVEGGVRIWRML